MTALPPYVAALFAAALFVPLGTACNASTVAGGGNTSSAPRVATSGVPKATTKDLDALPTAGARHDAGYSRTKFGPAWADVDHNHCDTRDDILTRDLTDTTKRGACTVLTGTLHDPYTGKILHFKRGKSTSTLIQIDHTVPLGLAWAEGAWKWPADEREQFANDPLELVAADGSANEAKGDKGPAEWRPDHGDWCAYATRTIDVSEKYKLPVTSPDRAELKTMLGTC